jgi:hypothetical protein
MLPLTHARNNNGERQSLLVQIQIDFTGIFYHFDQKMSIFSHFLSKLSFSDLLSMFQIEVRGKSAKTQSRTKQYQ